MCLEDGSKAGGMRQNRAPRDTGRGASGRTSAGTERDGSNRRVSSVEETRSELRCNRTTWMLCQEQTERGKGGNREILQENHPGCPGQG